MKGKPELVLTHSLKNTGKRVIETDVYDHNFFLLDHQPTGPGLVLRFPFLLTSEEARGLRELAAIRGTRSYSSGNWPTGSRFTRFCTDTAVSPLTMTFASRIM